MRTAAIHSILLNYSSLCEILETVNAETHDECGRKAGGYLAQMEKFSTFFGLNLSHLKFPGTEQLSLTLQGKDTIIQEGANEHSLLLGS